MIKRSNEQERKTSSGILRQELMCLYSREMIYFQKKRKRKKRYVI